MVLHDAAHAFVAAQPPGVWVDPARVSVNPRAHFFGTTTLLKPVDVLATSVSRWHQVGYVGAGPGINIALAVAALHLWTTGGMTVYGGLFAVHAIIGLWNLLLIRIRE